MKLAMVEVEECNLMSLFSILPPTLRVCRVSPSPRLHFSSSLVAVQWSARWVRKTKARTNEQASERSNINCIVSDYQDSLFSTIFFCCYSHTRISFFLLLTAEKFLFCVLLIRYFLCTFFLVLSSSTIKILLIHRHCRRWVEFEIRKK